MVTNIFSGLEEWGQRASSSYTTHNKTTQIVIYYAHSWTVCSLAHLNPIHCPGFAIKPLSRETDQEWHSVSKTVSIKGGLCGWKIELLPSLMNLGDSKDLEYSVCELDLEGDQEILIGLVS